MKILLAYLLVLCSVIQTFPQVSNVNKGNEYYTTGMKFYESKDYDSLIYYLKSALALRPDHPAILYNLAAGYALNDNPSRAIKNLNKIADMKLYYPVQKDSDFFSLRYTDDFAKILKKFADNFVPIVNSKVAFRLDEKGLLTEGLAYDKDTYRFFISSVHKRKIVEYKKFGRIRDFNSGNDSLLGIFGMRVDERNRFLWAAGSAIKNIKNYSTNMKGKGILYQFDLDNGRLLAEYRPSEKAEDHLFGDLTTDSRGNVFISDSRFNVIYKLSPEENILETFIPPGNFVSLQGITLTDNDSLLFAADYSQGILKVNMTNNSVVLLSNKTRTTLLGIDGLYYFNGRLIATQNGINPQRILSIKPDDSLSALINYDVLESNNPEFDEPTLGVIVGDAFYFISNSQWSGFKDDGTIFPDDKLDFPLILQLKLD